MGGYQLRRRRSLRSHQSQIGGRQIELLAVPVAHNACFGQAQRRRKAKNAQAECSVVHKCAWDKREAAGTAITRGIDQKPRKKSRLPPKRVTSHFSLSIAVWVLSVLEVSGQVCAIVRRKNWYTFLVNATNLSEDGLVVVWADFIFICISLLLVRFCALQSLRRTPFRIGESSRVRELGLDGGEVEGWWGGGRGFSLLYSIVL